MSLIRGIVKTVVVAKVIEIVGRELSKPANQRKVKDGLGKLSKAARQKR